MTRWDGSIAIGIAGVLLVLLAALDLFLTIFNYDGFTFVTGRFHRVLWSVLRRCTLRLMPDRCRHGALSGASAAMLPATVALWLGLEAGGFALLFYAGLREGAFALRGAQGTLFTAFYLSGGDLSSLTFGDVIPRTWPMRVLVDLETILGLATFTLALGYVVTTVGVLEALDDLHGRVTRHAEEPERPSSILARHFRGGRPDDLPAYLEQLGDSLESYEQGLRRYPVVYYFHTQRRGRSIPNVFATLGGLIALLRWGLPSDEPMRDDPFLAALVDGYRGTLERLRVSFVGPKAIDDPEPLARDVFLDDYHGDGDDPYVRGFRELERRARYGAGMTDRLPDDDDHIYARYAGWIGFAHQRQVVLDRVADTLGYARPSVIERQAGSDGAFSG